MTEDFELESRRTLTRIDAQQAEYEEREAFEKFGTPTNLLDDSLCKEENTQEGDEPPKGE